MLTFTSNWLGTIFYISYLVFEYPLVHPLSYIRTLPTRLYTDRIWHFNGSQLENGCLWIYSSGQSLLVVTPPAPTLEACSLVLWPVSHSVAQPLTYLGSTFHNGDVWGMHHGRFHDCHSHVLHSKRAKPTCGILVYVSSIRCIRQQVHWCLVAVLMNGTGLSRHIHISLPVPSCLALAQIISGFLSFGVLHITKSTLHPWQWCCLGCWLWEHHWWT
jgi:hypothetical protein